MEPFSIKKYHKCACSARHLYKAPPRKIPKFYLISWCLRVRKISALENLLFGVSRSAHSIGFLKCISFYKQLVHKQLALGCQTGKQLSCLSIFLVRNNKNYRLKKSKVFLCNKSKIAVKPTIQQNLTVSKALLGRF